MTSYSKTHLSYFFFRCFCTSLALTLWAQAGEFANEDGAITINDEAPASPDPSIVTVSGVTGIITNVRVKLNGFTHTAPDDVDIYLVSPNNDVVAVLSDGGGINSLTNVDLIFDDNSDVEVPDSDQITELTYIPTDYEPGEPIPSGANSPVRTALTELAGSGVNGIWKLYVSDDSTGESGSITSWSLEIESTNTLAATYQTGAEIPLTTTGFDGTNSTVNFALNYAPPLGTKLTVVNNTGLEFIQGEFDNLANGDVVELSYNNQIYSFVAWYYGGDGNDLVLQPRNTGLSAWGSNDFGQIGDNSSENERVAPARTLSTGALAGKTIVSIAAGSNHNLALCSDGTLVSWGWNSSGQLGDGSTPGINEYSQSPVIVDTSGVLSDKIVVAISAGGEHSIALCSDGTIASWGNASGGILGTGNSTSSKSSPVRVDHSGIIAGKTVVRIVAGNDYNLALCSDGTLCGWGRNSNGELGDNSSTNRLGPVLVDQSGVLADKRIIAIAAGDRHSLALCEDGTLTAWGYNRNGELGIGTTGGEYAESFLAPQLVNQTGVIFGKKVIAVTAGSYHSLVLCSDGSLAAWGDNGIGQLGRDTGSEDTFSSPLLVDQTEVLSDKMVINVSAGKYHNLGLCENRIISSWGWNDFGQLGDGTEVDRTEPVLVDQNDILSGNSVFDIAASKNGSTSLALYETKPEITISDSSDNLLTENGPDIDLGSDVLVDSSTNATFTIRNDGDAPLQRVEVNLEGLNSSDFEITSFPDSEVLPEESTSFTIKFEPSSEGEKVALLNILSTDADETAIKLTITGIGVKPEIEVEHPAGIPLTNGVGIINLGPTVLLGTIVEKEFAIYNSGSAALSEISIKVEGQDATDFCVVRIPPIEIGPKQTVSFVIRFSPTTTGQKTANIEINNNDSDEDPFLINLTANCTESLVVNATYSKETDTPLTGLGFNASGLSLNLALNYMPERGTNLTVVNNIIPGFIEGTFTNLVNGEIVNLKYGGKTYPFVAWYYGGDGNDLVLLWRDNSIASWGKNEYGQLGNNSQFDQSIPIQIAQDSPLAGKTIANVASGSNHSLALCTDGTLAAWGDNTYGQLGNGITEPSKIPVIVDRTGVLSDKTVIAIAAGENHSLALCSDGTVSAWGSGNNGQLGDNAYSDRLFPVLVDQTGVLAEKSVSIVKAGAQYSVALTSDGTIFAWGNGEVGQLGDGFTSSSSIPIPIDQSGSLAGKSCVTISAGSEHCLALCSDGTLASWGNNTSGQVGDSTFLIRPLPVIVDPVGELYGKNVSLVSAGDRHTLALCSDGTLTGWGYDGVDGGIQSSIPIALDQGEVLSDKTIIDIAAGNDLSTILCSDGTIASIGINDRGQLGDGTPNESSIPVETDQRIVLGDKFLRCLSLSLTGSKASHVLSIYSNPLKAPSSSKSAIKARFTKKIKKFSKKYKLARKKKKVARAKRLKAKIKALRKKLRAL